MRFPMFFSLPSLLPSGNLVEVPFSAGKDDYEPPLVVIPGGVRQITLGSSPSGNADANSQYYW
jgi:hypothetical protein